ncbi:hypothetical protein MANES_13G126300v8 [Manihot esculenta]|uniref:Uncharacterized protein n=1 Tax=Manihot esculenta TaxID=3983 RepID=A0A2C9URG2_MANES|nr:hypothetical protein MANES_13G126300v8 [Manihot esculenta]
MAAIRVMGTCIFLLVLMLCHEVLVVEGRHLKPHKLCKKCFRLSDQNSLNVSEDTQKLLGGQEKTSKMDYVDDFRPTEPGHSPGVGHSINN